jgi:hypothetical protein
MYSLATKTNCVKSNYIFMMKVNYNSMIVSLVVWKIQNVHFAHYLVQGLSTILKAQWGVAWLGRIKVGCKQNIDFNMHI